MLTTEQPVCPPRVMSAPVHVKKLLARDNVTSPKPKDSTDSLAYIQVPNTDGQNNHDKHAKKHDKTDGNTLADHPYPRNPAIGKLKLNSRSCCCRCDTLSLRTRRPLALVAINTSRRRQGAIDVPMPTSARRKARQQLLPTLKECRQHAECHACQDTDWCEPRSI